jgi:hypothetical protein
MRTFSHMGNLYKNDAKAARAQRARRRSGKLMTPSSTAKPGSPAVKTVAKARTPISARRMKSPAPTIAPTAEQNGWMNELFGHCVGQGAAGSPSRSRLNASVFGCVGGEGPSTPSSKKRDLLDMIKTPEGF